MYILAINDSQNDSGVALFKDSSILYAVNEERLARKKIIGGFPHKSIEAAFRHTKIKPEDIGLIIVSGILTPPLFSRIFRGLQKMEYNVRSKKGQSFTSYLSDVAQFKLKIHVTSPDSFGGKIQRKFLKQVFKKDLPKELKAKPLIFVDHHQAHAASAYYSSGFKEALCITADGCGDGVSLTISSCREGKIKRLFKVKAVNSYGWFYGLVTLFLGFQWHKHEGKVTGLAAYGDHTKVKAKWPFSIKNGKVTYSREWGQNGLKYLRNELSGYEKKDIAAWLQHHIEEHITRLVEDWVKKTRLSNIVLAGGLFANVKLNQRIHELGYVDNIYIFPHMGDGGLAYGSVLKHTEPEVRQLPSIYLGPSYSNEQIKKALDKSGLEYEHKKEIEAEIGKLLAQNKVVARFNSAMEYGPRALGNRSILYTTTDPAVNDWLNEKLNRTEFMPFAPATLVEYADKCYNNLSGAEFTARFMNITFDCTDWMKKNCPGVVHIDGTARPQLVTKEDNPSFHKIIKEYHKITGLPSIINTSFNMHEEPIVCTPQEAIKAFKEAKFDYLAIGNFLVHGGDSL